MYFLPFGFWGTMKQLSLQAEPMIKLNPNLEQMHLVGEMNPGLLGSK